MGFESMMMESTLPADLEAEEGDSRLFVLNSEIPAGGRCTVPFLFSHRLCSTGCCENGRFTKRKIGLTFRIAQPSVEVGHLAHWDRANFAFLFCTHKRGLLNLFYFFEYIAHSILRHFIN